MFGRLARARLRRRWIRSLSSYRLSAGSYLNYCLPGLRWSLLCQLRWLRLRCLKCRCLDCRSARGFERGHVIVVTLRCVIGVKFCAVERVLRCAGAQTAALGIEDGNADREGAEIHARDYAHEFRAMVGRPGGHPRTWATALQAMVVSADGDFDAQFLEHCSFRREGLICACRVRRIGYLNVVRLVLAHQLIARDAV